MFFSFSINLQLIATLLNCLKTQSCYSINGTIKKSFTGISSKNKTGFVTIKK